MTPPATGDPLGAGDRPGAGGLPGAGGPPGAGDLLLRVSGGLLSVLAGGLAGLLAVLLVPLRVAGAAEALGLTGLAGTEFGATRLPTAVLLAIGGNLLLVRLAESVTGARWAGLLPGLGWFAVMLLALRTTAEGDRLLLDGDWVGGLTLFGGTVVLVVLSVSSIASGPRHDRRSAVGSTRTG